MENQILLFISSFIRTLKGLIKIKLFQGTSQKWVNFLICYEYLK